MIDDTAAPAVNRSKTVGGPFNARLDLSKFQDGDSPGALEDVWENKDKNQTGIITKRDAKGVFKNNVRKLLSRKDSSKNLPV